MGGKKKLGRGRGMRGGCNGHPCIHQSAKKGGVEEVYGDKKKKVVKDDDRVGALSADTFRSENEPPSQDMASSTSLRAHILAAPRHRLHVREPI